MPEQTLSCKQMVMKAPSWHTLWHMGWVPNCLGTHIQGYTYTHVRMLPGTLAPGVRADINACIDRCMCTQLQAAEHLRDINGRVEMLQA